MSDLYVFKVALNWLSLFGKINLTPRFGGGFLFLEKAQLKPKNYSFG
jgi:hypothetical protein